GLTLQSPNIMHVRRHVWFGVHSGCATGVAQFETFAQFTHDGGEQVHTFKRPPTPNIEQPEILVFLAQAISRIEYLDIYAVVNYLHSPIQQGFFGCIRDELPDRGNFFSLGQNSSFIGCNPITAIGRSYIAFVSLSV